MSRTDCGTERLVMYQELSNARAAMLVTPEPITRLLSPAQLANAVCGMSVALSSIVTCPIVLYVCGNTFLSPWSRTDWGTVTFLMPLHPLNAESVMPVDPSRMVTLSIVS